MLLEINTYKNINILKKTLNNLQNSAENLEKQSVSSKQDFERILKEYKNLKNKNQDFYFLEKKLKEINLNEIILKEKLMDFKNLKLNKEKDLNEIKSSRTAINEIYENCV